MGQLSLLASEVARITEKLYKLQKTDIPVFFTEGFADVQTLLGRCLIIFAALLIVQAVVMCLKRRFERAVILTGTAVAALAVSVFAVPHITALGAWIWTF